MSVLGAFGKTATTQGLKALAFAAIFVGMAGATTAPARGVPAGSTVLGAASIAASGALAAEDHVNGDEREPARPMLVFAWNYTPDPQVTPVKRAVQAYFYWGDADRWEDRSVRFTVDGQTATTPQAAARLRELPVLTWTHPYHYKDIPGAPPNFSPESIKATEVLIAQAKTELLKILPEEALDRINHVTDFESFASYERPNLVAGTSFAVGTDHASTACHLFGAALRACGWDQKAGAGAANYGTSHGPRCPKLGVEPHFRQTPAHVPGSMDGKTTFLTGYTSGGPDGCLSEAELLDGIAKARGSTWLVIEDYQPRRGNVIRAAKASGKIRLLGLWGTEYDEKNPAPHDRQRNRQWARAQDSAIAEALR